jgi:uncharacterized protein YciI
VTVFAVTFLTGPSWDGARARREQAGWTEHAAFMDALLEEGFVVLGGPIGDGDRVLVVVEAPDRRSVEARFDADPWLVSGVLRIGEVLPWTLWLDGRRRRDAPH